MAAMDIEKARALAEQMIRTGQNKGRSLEDLVRQIVAESAGAPQTATGAGLMMAPPPRTVTPATPAPMQPGVPLVAPKPTVQTAPQPEPQPQAEAPQRAAPRPSELRPVLEDTLARIDALQGEIRQAAANKQQPDIMAQINLRALKDRAQQLQARVQAEEGASVPEELRSALEGRQARLARREELLAEAKARSPWEALIAGGAAMAQGRNGESFAEALSRGMQAGFQEYGRSRRAGEEGAESIAEAREQAMIDRYTMQEKAREAAAARVAGVQGMERDARKTALEDVEIPSRLRKGAAEAGKAEFELKSAPEEFRRRGALTDAQIANYGEMSGGDGGGANTTKGLSTLLTSLDREAAQLAKVTTSLTTPSKDKFAAAQRLAEVNAERQRIRAAIGAGRLGGAAPAAPAATAGGAGKASLVYVPGRGLQPVR